MSDRFRINLKRAERLALGHLAVFEAVSDLTALSSAEADSNEYHAREHRDGDRPQHDRNDHLLGCGGGRSRGYYRCHSTSSPNRRQLRGEPIGRAPDDQEKQGCELESTWQRYLRPRRSDRDQQDTIEHALKMSGQAHSRVNDQRGDES